jgi:hypothetical protein
MSLLRFLSCPSAALSHGLFYARSSWRQVGDFAGTVVLLIESQQDGFIVKKLAADGTADLPVGTPIGVLCENEELLPQVTRLSADAAALDKCQNLCWQSYLKESGSSRVTCLV